MSENWEIHSYFALGMGLIFGPKNDPGKALYFWSDKFQYWENCKYAYEFTVMYLVSRTFRVQNGRCWYLTELCSFMRASINVSVQLYQPLTGCTCNMNIFILIMENAFSQFLAFKLSTETVNLHFWTLLLLKSILNMLKYWGLFF